MGIKVNWFIPVNHKNYNNMPASVWIRCLQLIPYLEELGVKCTVNDVDSDADIDVFVRCQNNDAYELAKRCKNKGHKLIFDLCVNYLDESAIKDTEDRITREHFIDAQNMVGLSNCVTCASRKISDTTKKFHDFVYYISDSVDRRHFCKVKPIKDFIRKKLRVIWSGVHSKSYELIPILPMLKDLNIELIIISDMPPVFKTPGVLWKHKYPYVFRKWKYETFPQEIVKGDLCVSSRDMTCNYNLGHSLFKVGVFMAQGVPALVSPQPSYIELMTNGLSDNVCNSISEWELKLSQISNNRNDLIVMSKKSIQAMEPYITDRIINQYIELIEMVV